MNIFTILASLVMLALAVFTVVAIPCILWFGRKQSWKFRGGLLLLACIPLPAFMFWWSSMSSYEPSDPKDLANGFQFELHHPLTTDVSGLQIKRVVIGDGVGSWARFEATPEVVDMLIKDFSPSDNATFYTGNEGANVPGWWEPEADGMTEYYYAEHWEEGCSTFSYAYLAHDKAKRIVYFSHSGS